jgi:polyvinyl alcohol dehydrogenase (cytochrome)
MNRSIWSMLAQASIVLAIIAGGVMSALSPQSAVQAASGDWPTFLFNNGRSGFNGSETKINVSTVSNLKVQWTHSQAARISSQPVEANGMIYWGSWDGLEHASSLSTGTDLWTKNLGTSGASCDAAIHGVASSAAIATEQINGVATPVDYVGGGGVGTFYALNANTGTVIWQKTLSSQTGAYTWGSPAVFNNSVYIGTSSLADCPLMQGQVIQLNAVTGVIQHTFNTAPAGCTGDSVWSSPTLDSKLHVLYVSTGNGGTCSTTETFADSLVALNTSNLSLVASWQVPPAQQISDGDFGATPTLFQATIGGTVHQMVGLINKNGTYYALDRSNIAAGPLWQSQLATPTSSGVNISSSAWDGTRLYAAGGQTTINGKSCTGSLGALLPATGAFHWHDCFSTPSLVTIPPVIAVTGVAEVAVGSSFMAMNSSTGKTLFTYTDTNTNSVFLGPASISNGVLYTGNADGNLYAFAP